MEHPLQSAVGDLSLFELVAKYLRHALAHPKDHPNLNCMFCPTLAVTPPPEGGEPQLLHPGLFPEPFLRWAAELVNKVYSMALDGDPEAVKFLLDFGTRLNPPPDRRTAVALPLPSPISEGSGARRAG